jgi:hypothetical protein
MIFQRYGQVCQRQVNSSKCRTIVLIRLALHPHCDSKPRMLAPQMLRILFAIHAR